MVRCFDLPCNNNHFSSSSTLVRLLAEPSAFVHRVQVLSLDTQYLQRTKTSSLRSVDGGLITSYMDPQRSVCDYPVVERKHMDNRPLSMSAAESSSTNDIKLHYSNNRGNLWLTKRRMQVMHFADWHGANTYIDHSVKRWRW